MINMIQMECYKLKKQKIFYIILLFVGVISIMSSISAIQLDSQLNGKTQFTVMFHDISMLFVCAIFAAIYIGNDFNNRTIQSQIASGHSREKIVIAKLFVFMIAAQMILILYPVIGAITVTISRGWGTIVSYQEINYIILLLAEAMILNIGTSSYFVLFAFLCRDIPKTICLSMAFPIIFSIVKESIEKIPLVGYLIKLMSISQIGQIGVMNISGILILILSSIITLLINFFIAKTIIGKAEIK